MKFSILVPVYNVEQYLEQCVESLLNQSYQGEYEVILVDDGSTDLSGIICDKYADSYPNIIKVVHKENEGLVSARQTGIEVAIGEYSLFVDSDDFVENNLLEKVSDCINRYNNPDMVIYSFKYYSNGKTIERKSTLATNETVFTNGKKNEIYEALISTSLITSLWTKALKTEILKIDPTDYRVYYDKNMAEDRFRSINLITLVEKIVYINDPLYIYRMNNKSISKSYRIETISKKNTLYVYERFEEYLSKWGMDDEETRKKLKARWLNETMYTFSKYMENAGSVKDIRTILNYNWSSMLPEGVENNPNEHENKSYRYLFEKLKSKKYVSIILFFIKKKSIRKIRDLKSKVLGK